MSYQRVEIFLTSFNNCFLKEINGKTLMENKNKRQNLTAIPE